MNWIIWTLIIVGIVLLFLIGLALSGIGILSILTGIYHFFKKDREYESNNYKLEQGK